MAQGNEQSDWIYDADVVLTEGLTANNSGNSLKVTDEYGDSELNIPGLSQFSNAVITVDAREYSSALKIVGNYQNNVISVGSGGGEVDGGSGGDKIYLGDGDDVLQYTSGRGRDTIYNYDGESGDIVSLSGATVGTSDFTPIANGNVYLVTGTDTLTFVNPTKQFIVQDDDGNLTNIDLRGMTFTTNRQAVTLDGDYQESDFDGTSYSRLVSINADSVGGMIDIAGNDNNNMITVGGYGGQVDAGAGNDKIYGGDGDDVFIHSAGNDTIYRYDGDNDYVSVGGVSTLSKANFIPTALGTVLLDLGEETLTFHNPEGVLYVHYGEDDEVFEYDPSGLIFTQNRRTVTVTSDYPEDDFDATEYNLVLNIAASTDNALNIIGNANDNAITAAGGGGSIDGGLGHDKLYGGEGQDVFVYTVGSGGDTIYNFDGDNDEIQLIDYTGELVKSSFLNTNLGKLYIDLGNDTLTLYQPTGNVKVNYGTEDEPLEYIFEADGINFATNRTAATLTSAYEGDEFDANEYDQVKRIDASRVEHEVNIIGNDNDNLITVGAYGGKVDGGNGNDSIVGGEGDDVFVHTVGAGRDTFANYGEDDVIEIYNFDGEMTLSNFIPLEDGILLIDLGNDTLTLTDPINEVNVRYGVEDAIENITYDRSGATVTTDRRIVSINDDYPNSELLATDYGSDIVTINATRRTEPIDLYGNDNDNIISLGSGGGLADGGLGNDIFYAGSGNDTFVHTLGEGSDTVYNYDRSGDDGDALKVIGVDELDENAFKLATGGVVQIDLGNDTLTLVNPSGVITVVDENDQELGTFDVSGVELVSNKLLEIKNGYNDSIVNAANFGDEIETITAATYNGEPISIVGNDRNNVIRAGRTGGTLDGGSGADRYYGGDGADTFIVTVGAGNKTIYNYVTTLEGAEDVVALVGDVPDIDRDNFTEVGSQTTLTVGTTQVIFVNPRSEITVVDENGSEIYTYGMPEGLTLSADRTTLTVGDNYGESTLDIGEYNSRISTVVARQYTSELELTGNLNDNVIYGATGGGTMDGGLGNDVLYAGDGVDVIKFGRGVGNDTVYNFDASDDTRPDMIMVSGVDSLSQSAVRQTSNGNVELKVGSNTLTLITPNGAVTVVNEDGEELLHFDTTGSSLTTDEKILYVGSDYTESIVAANNYSTMVATIDAQGFPDPLVIEGNSNANVIYAGPGGSTLDGAGYIDHLYGNDGRDVYRYTVGEGNDYIHNFDSTVEDAGDVIQLLGVNKLDRTNFRDTANGQTLIQVGTSVLTLIDPVGAISVYGSDMYDEYDELQEPLFVYGHSLPAGTEYNYNKVALTINSGADLTDEDKHLYTPDYSNNLRKVYANYYEEEITLEGDEKSNEFHAGSGGSSMDGGAGNDLLYGGAGADTFVYSAGDGSDYIYNFDSSNEDAFDVVQLLGEVGTITRSSFRDSGNNTILTLGNYHLTFVEPLGQITLLDSEGDTITTYGSTLESDVGYNIGKTKLTIGRDAELEDVVVDMETLSSNLRDVNAAQYEGELYLLGNDKANELRAGSGGSTIDGRGGSDIYYGGAGADYFVVSVGGGGNEQIYNYNAEQGDVIQLIGAGTITRSNFQDSDSIEFLTVDNGKILIYDPQGAITVVDEDGDELLVYGKSLPSGVEYSASKTKLTITREAELEDEVTFDVSDYVNNLRDINAAAYEGDEPLVLIGDGRMNELRAAVNGSSLDGGRGNDKLYGGNGADTFVYQSGDDDDVIYNYDGRQGDVIQLIGFTDINRDDFRDGAGSTIILQVGDNSITFNNAHGPFIVADEEGNTIDVTYDEELPSGVEYNTSRTKLTIGRVDELDENTFDMDTLANNIRDIDASRYEYEINLLGNDKVNELRAGSGGSLLDGRYGNDKIYGGAGADTYVVSVGSGYDNIYNYNGNQEDVVLLYGVDMLDRSAFIDNGSNVLLNTGSERITFHNPSGMITVLFADSGESLTYGENLPTGFVYSADKTDLTIRAGAEVEDGLIDMSALSNNLRNVNASAYEEALTIDGNDLSNVIRAGSGGSSLDGGDGNDKLYGGAGADTYVYHAGEGNDHIYNYNGSQGDVIQILDYDTTMLDDSIFRESGRNTIVMIGSNRLTVANAQGRIVLVDENGEEIVAYNSELPAGVYYNSSKTKLTVSREADLTDDNLLDAATLSNNLKEIDATTYEGTVLLAGNRRSNILRASSGGASMDGGRGTDNLYGGNGADTYSYHSGEGNDYIYNYNGNDGDVIKLFGVTSLDESSIRDNNGNVAIAVGSNRLTLVDPIGQIVILDEYDSTLATYNDVLPDGVTTNRNKTTLIVAADAELEESTVDLADYSERIQNVDATAYPGEINIVGNDNANELYAGTGGSTLDGGVGNDKLYGNSGIDVFRYNAGDGNDRIYNYDASDAAAPDIVELTGVGSLDKSDFRESGRNTILTIGTNRLTFVNPLGALQIYVDGSDEPFVYGTNLPSGIRYNGSKTKMTIANGANLSELDNTINLEDYPNSLKDVNASAYTEEIAILGDDKNNELRAGSGGSTLSGGGGNDKLYGGDGADLFVYSAGKDAIYNYNPEADLISIGDAVVTGARVSGNDVVYSIGDGTLTVKNGAQYGIMGINFGDELSQQPSGDPLSEILSVSLDEILSADNVGLTDIGGYDENNRSAGRIVAGVGRRGDHAAIENSRRALARA